MLSSIYRVFVQRNASFVRVISSTHDKSCYLQLNPYSSVSRKPISQTSNQEFDIVDYLIKKFGLSPKKAITASKYLKFDSVEKPDSVVAFFKSQGFEDEVIVCIIRCCSLILTFDTQKTLLPKIEFFRSLGISEKEMIRIFVVAPNLFQSSLEKQIIPALSYIKTLFESCGTSFAFTQRLAMILRCGLNTKLIPNIEILREAGLPDSRILCLLHYQPRTLMLQPAKFRKVVDKVKQMNFSPLHWKFILALHTFVAVCQSTWDKKVAVYKKWGWSEHDIILAFEKYPYCMTLSTGKIMAVMDFLVNKMGIDSSWLVKRSDIFSFSVEKRIKPRGSIYKTLLANGLINKDDYIKSIFNVTEAKFLEKFVLPYEKEVPGLMRLYEKELAASKSSRVR